MPAPTGAEAAKGLIEKVPGLVSFPVTARVLAPGALAVGLIYPFTGIARPQLASAQSADLAVYLPLLIWLVGLLVAALVLGAIASVVLGGEIYKIYEGRILWPAQLTTLGVKIEGARVARLMRQAKAASGDPTRYDELWFRLRAYPLDASGEPTAKRPTRLGNILAEYEEYPATRYGMDSVFYWPRLWLVVEKEKKEEIDGAWALADGLLVISAVSVVGAIGWLAAAGCRALTSHPTHLLFGSSAATAVGGLGLLVVAAAAYRISLPFHRQNGEVFKSIYDLYRDKLVAMTRVGTKESATWEGIWLYLQYLTIRCVRCGTTYPSGDERCPNCSLPRAQSLDLLRRSDDARPR